MKFILEKENTNMSERNIFEQATRGKYRFPFKGLCTVEDLWDLNVINLDDIYKELNKQKKSNSEDSLLETSSEDVRLNDMIEIIKHIVSVKQKEKADKVLERERKERNQMIMNIIKDKEYEDLKSKSISELMGIVDSENK